MQRFLYVFSLVILSFPNGLIACECTEEQKESLKESMEKADVIFVGKVKRERNRNSETRFDFEVYQTWKQKLKKPKVRIKSTTKCDAHFFLEKDYLVFAYGGGKKGFYRADRCSRTDLVEERTEDIKSLGVATQTFE